MTRGARLAAIVASFVVVLVALVLTLSSSSGDDGAGSSSPAAADRADSSATRDRTADAEEFRTPTPKPDPAFEVMDGSPVGGVRAVSAKKGDRVRFTVSVDQPETVHLHGYDIEKPATPGKPASFDFKADIDGVFEVELERSALLVLNLRVSP